MFINVFFLRQQAANNPFDIISICLKRWISDRDLTAQSKGSAEWIGMNKRCGVFSVLSSPLFGCECPWGLPAEIGAANKGRKVRRAENQGDRSVLAARTPQSGKKKNLLKRHSRTDVESCKRKMQKERRCIFRTEGMEIKVLVQNRRRFFLHCQNQKRKNTSKFFFKRFQGESLFVQKCDPFQFNILVNVLNPQRAITRDNQTEKLKQYNKGMRCTSNWKKIQIIWVNYNN